jgi:hypothetical protein
LFHLERKFHSDILFELVEAYTRCHARYLKHLAPNEPLLVPIQSLLDSRYPEPIEAGALSNAMPFHLGPNDECYARTYCIEDVPESYDLEHILIYIQSYGWTLIPYNTQLLVVPLEPLNLVHDTEANCVIMTKHEHGPIASYDQNMFDWSESQKRWKKRI